jgi:hypothetical protein
MKNKLFQTLNEKEVIRENNGSIELLFFWYQHPKKSHFRGQIYDYAYDEVLYEKKVNNDEDMKKVIKKYSRIVGKENLSSNLLELSN